MNFLNTWARGVVKAFGDEESFSFWNNCKEHPTVEMGPSDHHLLFFSIVADEKYLQQLSPVAFLQMRQIFFIAVNKRNARMIIALCFIQKQVLQGFILKVRSSCNNALQSQQETSCNILMDRNLLIWTTTSFTGWKTLAKKIKDEGKKIHFIQFRSLGLLCEDASSQVPIQILFCTVWCHKIFFLAGLMPNTFTRYLCYSEGEKNSNITLPILSPMSYCCFNSLVLWTSRGEKLHSEDSFMKSGTNNYSKE